MHILLLSDVATYPSIKSIHLLKCPKEKSFISSLLSILIVLLSFTFGLYSIIDYIIYSTPSISYLKKYDVSTNRTILLKDSLFMFKIHGYCNNNISDEINDDINCLKPYYLGLQAHWNLSQVSE